MRKTKIICTLGPSTDNDVILKELIDGGMNVARFNFSHGTHEEHDERMARLRRMREECQKPVAILLDTKGPEIRVGCFEDEKIKLEAGQEFTLVCHDVPGTASQVSVSYPKLYQDVAIGSSILIDDGLVELEVKSL